jgi:putative membrane protein
MFRRIHYEHVFSKRARCGRPILRVLAIGLSAITASQCGITALAASGADIDPVCDETYYATLDYYGGIKEGSVVKSYQLDGVTELKDYGRYDGVVNLTDDTQPDVGGDEVTFRFAQDQAPGRFYFEGKTTKPFSELPWKISLSYRLNGERKKAEELGGAAGLVEIDIDAVPNENAPEYSRDNFVLEAAAVFNADDILSLEAPGAQVQMIGNLRAVLFMVMPGEEQHDISGSDRMILLFPASCLWRSRHAVPA